MYFNWYNDKIWGTTTTGYTPVGGSVVNIAYEGYTFTKEYFDGTITCSGTFPLNDGRVLTLAETTLTYVTE